MKMGKIVASSKCNSGHKMCSVCNESKPIGTDNEYISHGHRHIFSKLCNLFDVVSSILSFFIVYCQDITFAVTIPTIISGIFCM